MATREEFSELLMEEFTARFDELCDRIRQARAMGADRRGSWAIAGPQLKFAMREMEELTGVPVSLPLKGKAALADMFSSGVPARATQASPSTWLSLEKRGLVTLERDGRRILSASLTPAGWNASHALAFIRDNRKKLRGLPI